MPILYNRNDAYVQINPVQEQATQLWETLSQQDTAVVYQQAVAKTWKLLKQAIALIVFLFVSLVALIFWIWGIGFQSGFHFRKWLEVKQPNVNEVVGLFLKILFWPLILAFQWANSFVKKYLGWEVQFDLSSSETTPETTGETSTPPKDSLTN